MTEMRDDRPDDKIDRELLDAWEVPDPPADLADRVLRRLNAQVPAPRPRRWPWLTAAAGAGALAAAAAVVLILVHGGGTATSGAASTSTRQSLALGGRAVAVAEVGATLAWQVDRHGAARVEQSMGDVFYRVERGGRFVVATPAGDVSVLGTCFRVEVSPMRANKQSLTAAAIGAAGAAILVVSVYEGKVLLANEHGQVELAAGEQARATADSSPAVLPPQAALEAPEAGATREELLRRDEDQRRELALLRDRLKRVEGERQAAQQSGGGRRGDFTSPFMDTPKDELARLAAECRIAFDTPPLTLEPFALGDTERTELGLTVAQQEDTNRRLSEYHGRVLREMRALYVEVTGDREHVDDLSPAALGEEITQKSPRGEAQLILQKLARERAGMAAPPADVRSTSAVERYFRLTTGLGDEFERQLGAGIGTELAHALRKKEQGWGSKNMMSAGCPK